MNPIRVKVVSRAPKETWLRQFPDYQPVWGRCRFILDPDSMEYDWLFVYDEVIYRNNGGRKCKSITHTGHPKNTILLTVEPPNIKSYGRAYVRQFGWVLTSQPPWALPHPGRIYSQPAMRWFYGAAEGIGYKTMASSVPVTKSKLLSTVCSSKKQRHTLHHRRYSFTQALKREMPAMEIFGRGVRPIHDKSEALDGYKYHVAIENYYGLHHWTEKLADAFLGACLPFYAGCPNAEDYFPADSFIPIDIHDPQGAARIIRKAIDNGEYERRLPSILEARRRVLEQYNLFAVLSREIQARHIDTPIPARPHTVWSRRFLRWRPDIAVMDVYDKYRIRLKTFLCQ